MPHTLSHYRLEGEIGRGGMGVVYRAIDTRLRRALAIKVLPPEATADGDHPPEVQAANVAPRVKVPVLVVHGRDDFANPAEAQQRFVELLGTPPEHKRHAVLDGGHVPMDMRGLFREALDFLDKYLGPVR